jgi:hypothetical protein
MSHPCREKDNVDNMNCAFGSVWEMQTQACNILYIYNI